MKKENNPLHGHGYGGANLDNVQIITLKEVDSTNNYLRSLLADEEKNEIVVAVAKNQTAGRGQRGNSWESELGKNLTFSILIRPTFIEARQQFILSQAIALSIKEVLYDYVRAPHPRIKWPNDIYWNNKKLGGILIENDLTGKSIDRCIIGVGVNLNQEHFTSNAPNPVSVWQITGHTTEPLTILREIMQRFSFYYGQIKQGNTHDIIDDYEKSLFRRVGFHKFRLPGGEEFDARIRSIEPDGHLVLEDTQGQMHTFGFKEVEYVLN